MNQEVYELLMLLDYIMEQWEIIYSNRCPRV